ncbi:MAG: hypothetical protein QOI82_92 [Actinomycetota bacterium]|jgi:hypothetical protein|nr:hypothetical protein [Actinomycetota bacterium]
MTEPPAAITVETFTPHIGTAFTSRSAGAELQLVEVEGPGDRAGGRPFTVTFTGSAVFGQGTYDLQHPELGALHVFLVPRQPLADGVPRYDAVFN